MIACKEELIWFEELARKQHQIFDDSADFGIEISESQKIVARKNIMALRAIYGGLLDKYTSNNTYTVIPIIYENESPETVNGVLLRIYYTKIKGKEYLSIEFEVMKDMFIDLLKMSYKSRFWE